MKLLVGPNFDYPILASVGVAAGTLIAVEGPSFVTGFSGMPEFATSNQTLLHMEGATPQPIGTPGTPPVVAPPSAVALSDRPRRDENDHALFGGRCEQPDMCNF